MTIDCPRCGEPAVGAVATEPGLEQYAPCGCRVATDGGSVQPDGGERGARSVDDTEHLTEESHCPDCGRRTLTTRGITISYNDGTQGGATWLDCVNCEWDNKGGQDDE